MFFELVGKANKYYNNFTVDLCTEVTEQTLSIYFVDVTSLSHCLNVIVQLVNYGTADNCTYVTLEAIHIFRLFTVILRAGENLFAGRMRPVGRSLETSVLY